MTTNTTEILKVHEYTPLEDIESEPDDKFINDVNSVLPDNLFSVYDARPEPGIYIVELKEITGYTEA